MNFIYTYVLTTPKSNILSFPKTLPLSMLLIILWTLNNYTTVFMYFMGSYVIIIFKSHMWSFLDTNETTDERCLLTTCESALSRGTGVGGHHFLPILCHPQVEHDMFCANFWSNVTPFRPHFSSLSLLLKSFLLQTFDSFWGFCSWPIIIFLENISLVSTNCSVNILYVGVYSLMINSVIFYS